MAKNEVLYGIHTLSAMLERRPENVLELFFLTSRDDARLEKVRQQAQRLGLSMNLRSREQLDKLADSTQHQGVVARVRESVPGDDNDLDALLDGLTEPPFLLVLDGVTDPHNLGACLRTADAVGVHAVVTPRDRAAGLTPVARKVAVGAAEVLPFFQVTNLARTLGRLKERGLFVTGTALEPESRSLYESDLKGPLVVIMGAEGTGMRRLTRESCDQLVYIPMSGSVESLNVSVATGVVLYEARRQRG